MNLKQKLIYTMFGALLTLMGMLFASAFSPPLIAQRDGEIICTSLTVVDEAGNACITLDTDEDGGMVSVGNKTEGTLVRMSVTDDGGTIGINGKTQIAAVLLGATNLGGFVATRSHAGKGIAALTINEDGGSIAVRSNYGRGAVLMRIAENGGRIATLSTLGNVTGILPITQEPRKNSTDASTYSHQPESSVTGETEQRETTGSEAWLGTWSLEFIDGEPTAENLASDLGSDIFVSWNYTFYADGRFESKLRQDTGNGIITTTASGTYQVSDDMYETMLNEAVMSMGETSVPVPNVTSHQIGTWSRTGDTLTVIPAGSPTKVFKRKY